jgi:hypothetical protein
VLAPNIAALSPAAAPVQNHSRRRAAYAAALVAAVLLASGGLLLSRDRTDREAPVQIAKNPSVPSSPARPPDQSRQLDADRSPEESATRQPEPEPSAAPAAIHPAPHVPTPELAAAEPPAAEAPAEKPSAESSAEEQRLAQSGPQIMPEGVSAVYGPPAPTGLGIAGAPRGSVSFPGETRAGGRGPRGQPTSTPPQGAPPPSAPRGPGPRL